MNRKFAKFLFDQHKEGFERYQYVGDMETSIDNEPELQKVMKVEFDLLIGKPDYVKQPAGNVVDPYNYLKVRQLGCRVTINNIRFKDYYTTFIPSNGTKELVFAERYYDKTYPYYPTKEEVKERNDIMTKENGYTEEEEAEQRGDYVG